MMMKKLKLKNPGARSRDSGENEANPRGAAVFGFRVFNVRLEESVLSVGCVGRVWERLDRSWKGARGVSHPVSTAQLRFADIWGVLGTFGDICSKWHGGGGSPAGAEDPSSQGPRSKYVGWDRWPAIRSEGMDHGGGSERIRPNQTVRGLDFPIFSAFSDKSGVARSTFAQDYGGQEHAKRGEGETGGGEEEGRSGEGTPRFRMNDMPGSLGRRPGWKDGLESGVKPPHSKRWRAVQRPVRKPDDWAGEFPVLSIRSETRNLGLSLGGRRFQKSVPCNSTYLQNRIKLRVEDNFRSRRRHCAIQGPKGADPGSSGILHDNSFTTPLPGPNKLRRLFAQAVIMKTILIFVSLAAVVAVLCAGTVSPSPSLVAHEWGTFTSLQGANGALIPWKPLTTSQLPGFVYDWQRPGLNRLRAGQIFKGEMITLQRMETPVIYFYSDRKASVDVDVRFPQGTITEWYPQAPRVGPSMIPGPQTVTKFESILQRCGLSSL